MSKSDTLFRDFIRAINSDETEKVRRMLQNPDLDANKIYGCGAPFTLACTRSGIETVRCFLDCGRDIDFDHEGTLEWGLACAVKREHLSMVKMLVDDPRVNINHKDDYEPYYNILHYCVKTKTDSLEMVKVVLASDRFECVTSVDEYGNTAEQLAFRWHRMECSEFIHEFIRDPVSVRRQLQEELGYPARNAGELFATVVLLCDDYLKIK